MSKSCSFYTKKIPTGMSVYHPGIVLYIRRQLMYPKMFSLQIFIHKHPLHHSMRGLSRKMYSTQNIPAGYQGTFKCTRVVLYYPFIYRRCSISKDMEHAGPLVIYCTGISRGIIETTIVIIETCQARFSGWCTAIG